MVNPNETSDNTIKLLKKSNFRLKVMLGAMIFFCLISFVYAFVQKAIADENLAEASEQRAKAVEQMKVAQEQRMKLEKCADEARMVQKMAERSAEAARRAQQQAEEALRKSAKK